MDYELLYDQTQLLEKSWKEKTSLAAKLQKAITKELAAGDVKAATKDIAASIAVHEDIGRIVGELQQALAGFDAREYLESGAFTKQMLDLCLRHAVDVVGTFPNFEMFPYKVRVDVENQDLFLDRRKISCMRPEFFVQTVKQEREKLMKASFNAGQFANELAAAYDLAVLKLDKKADADIYLNTLYKFLVPMSRARKEYDLQSYAFDLARLYLSDPIETKDGRTYQFGPSRNNNKAIRILDGEGREQFLATIRFYA
ncbi:MAG: hypothetical protein CVV46_10565 [Spirochaetae bacterium HGW-Spirochaetae-2]|jgi:hypothetical protein|nr:MAG: hypothetical protein CVV46_10565 [Spirochaetae bacterium HGW-Spirochaetae-2]